MEVRKLGIGQREMVLGEGLVGVGADFLVGPVVSVSRLERSVSDYLHGGWAAMDRLRGDASAR
jgi:hypothetical protein